MDVELIRQMLEALRLAAPYLTPVSGENRVAFARNRAKVRAAIAAAEAHTKGTT